jgi:hypothetical protein
VIPGRPQVARPAPRPDQAGRWDPAPLLRWEFEYAQETAHAALRERRATLNAHLVVAGVIFAGVIALLALGYSPRGVIPPVEPLLLWLLSSLGWPAFFELIRLRQAWHDSARAMARIRDFYLQQARDFERDGLREALLWRIEPLPFVDRPWAVFLVSALLIGGLDSVAYVLGGLLLNPPVTLAHPAPIRGTLVLFGLILLAFHIWLYFASLKPRVVQIAPVEAGASPEPE